MNMDISIDTLIDAIEDAVYDNNSVKTLALVLELKQMVRTDPVAVKWITDPANLKYLHEILVEELDVPASAMMIKNRVPHKQRRALLFVEGILNGVRRIV